MMQEVEGPMAETGYHTVCLYEIQYLLAPVTQRGGNSVKNFFFLSSFSVLQSFNKLFLIFSNCKALS